MNFIPMILRKIMEQMTYQPRLIKNMVLYFIFKCNGEIEKKCGIFTIVEKRKAENSIFIVSFFKKKNQRMR